MTYIVMIAVIVLLLLKVKFDLDLIDEMTQNSIDATALISKLEGEVCSANVEKSELQIEVDELLRQVSMMEIELTKTRSRDKKDNKFRYK